MIESLRIYLAVEGRMAAAGPSLLKILSQKGQRRNIYEIYL